MTRTFEVAPLSSAPYLFIFFFSLLIAVLLALSIYYGFTIKNLKFDISDHGIHIRGGFYGRLIPRDDIVSQGVRVLNLNLQQEYQPKLKTNGVSLPGYSEGWFKLRNEQKALLFVSDKAKVVYIPTSKNYSVLLSVSNPEEFRQTLTLWK